jgi:DNA polymerase II small subunit
MSRKFSTKAKDFDLSVDITKTVGADTRASEKVEAFRDLFLDRYKTIKRYVETNYDFQDSISIETLVGNREKYSSWGALGRTIVMVLEAKKTHKGYLRLVVEDTSGEMDAMVSPEVLERIGTIATDDVIGIEGQLSKDGGIFWVRHVVFPQMIKKDVSEEECDPVSAAFISDIHRGADNFLDKEWNKMLDWLNSDDPMAQNIGYLVISGDIVDGVGVYPNQEQELDISDLYEQYQVTGTDLERVPDHLETIILPGNHDAVRLAEPQPVLSSEVQSHFNHGHFVGNPCRFKISGKDVLSYHGKSIDDMVMNLKEASYENPENAMKQMLKRRHLAPQWGVKNQIASEPTDMLTIETTPDIFVTGHTHGHCMQKYQDVQLIVSSTWQGQTSFQKMVGFEPKPAIVSVVKLDDGEAATVNFY